jgi:hypothetical protein
LRQAFPAVAASTNLDDWVYFIIDTREGMISFYHPMSTNIYILTSEANDISLWRQKARELKMDWKSGFTQCGLVNEQGELISAQSVPSN